VDLPEGVTRISARERLSHPDPAERAAAARVLGVLGNADDAAALVRSAREDSSAWVRGAASLALTEVGRAAAGPAIVEGLEPCARRDAAPRRCQWLVRAAAALIEGEEEPPEGSSALRERLERIATLGPKETGALIMELVFDVQLEP
jgi:HEAT repeat protein